jgi:Phage integrase family
VLSTLTVSVSTSRRSGVGSRQKSARAAPWPEVNNPGALTAVNGTQLPANLIPRGVAKRRFWPATAGRLSSQCAPWPYKAHRHLKSELVFCHPDGKPFTQSAIEAALRFGCKRAGLRIIGSQVLRHTFCSHLAMRGAAPKAIQELVGHSTLSMTLRYMHLAPSALCEAIDLLNFGQLVGSALSTAV